MPSPSRETAKARPAPESGTRAQADTGAWSARLAQSPRQLRQAEQLRSLFGARAGVPGAGVVQGMFLAPNGEEIRTEEAARRLAGEVIDVHETTYDDVDPMQRNEFVQALVQLATDGDDHRQLGMDELLDLLARGRVNERFGIEQSGRRLHTTVDKERVPNFPPERSTTSGKLNEVAQRPTKKKRKKGDDGGSDGEDSDSEGIESKGDFTYRDLRAILDQSGIGNLPPERIEAAVRQAVADWRHDSLGFSDRFPVDVQLVVQHLLHYHAFNSPMLKGRYRVNPQNEPQGQRLEREAENRSRQHELEKSRRLLVTDSRNRFMLTMPPDPTPGHMDYAFSGLQDVNRPLPNSALQGAAYKAVYLCVKKVLRASLDRALEISPQSTHGELDRQQRLRFNRALVALMPDFEKSTVGHQDGSGVNYVRNTIGLSRFSAQEEYSDEDSASSEEEDELPRVMRRSILDETANVEVNEGKIKTWSATIGTLSKLSLQKQLIDQATLEGQQKTDAERKHLRRRRKLERHVKRVSRRMDYFKAAQSELNYLKTKRALLDKTIAQLNSDWAEADDEMKPVFEYRRTRVEGLLELLNGFYQGASVRNLAGREDHWKRSHRIMRHLGKQGLLSYMKQGEPKVEPKAEEEASSEDDEPQKKKRKVKIKGKGKSTGKSRTNSRGRSKSE